MTGALVLLGAACGAPARWLLDRLVQGRHETGFPFGTLLINVVGSLLLGLLLGATSGHPAGWLLALVGTGFCGGFTTYGSFAYELVRLTDERRYAQAGWYLVGSVGVGLLAATAGWAVGTSLGG